MDETTEAESELVELFMFVGGPLHGHARIVETDDNVLTVFPPPESIPPGEVAMPELYVRRAIEVKLEGVGRRSVVYVHNSVKSPGELLPILANALLYQFLSSGEEVELDEPAETKSSLLLPGQ